MRRLADQIRTWKVAYYESTPLVDDATFDLWWKNLTFLESKYPHLMDPASPTVGVGTDMGYHRDRPRLTLAELSGTMLQRP